MYLYDNFEGRVHELVAAEGAKWPADVIVIGTHGRRGIGRMVLGISAKQPMRVRLPSAALSIE